MLKMTFDFQESRGVYEIQFLPSHSFQLKQILHYIYSNKKRIIQYLFQQEKNCNIYSNEKKYYNIYSNEKNYYNIYSNEKLTLQYLIQGEKNITIFIPRRFFFTTFIARREKNYNIYSSKKKIL